MSGRRLVVLSLCLALLTVVFSGVFTSKEAAADTLKSSWDAKYPAVGSLYNQSISKAVYVPSIQTTLSLTITLGRFDYTNTGNTQGKLSVQVAVAASTRQDLAYGDAASARYSTKDFDKLVASLGSSVHLSPNTGTWINFGYPIWYYGEWYSRVWVTENGFLSFNPHADDPENAAKYTSPTPPTAIPSGTDANAHGFVAPFWTQLSGGMIYYGTHFSRPGNIIPVDEEGIIIAWVGLGDSQYGGHNFAVRFQGYPGTEPANRGLFPRSIDFIYKDSTCTGITWKAGIENQEGTHGNSLGGCPGAGTIRKFAAPSTAGTIRDVSTSATKHVLSGANDATSFIYIFGWDQGTGTTSFYPPGHNVAQKRYVEDEYLHLPDQTPLYFAILQYGALTLLPLAFAFPIVAIPAIEIMATALDVTGLVVDTVQLIGDFQAAQQMEGSAAVVNPADTAHAQAWTKNQAVQSWLPIGDPLRNEAWTIGILPQYQWYMDTTSAAGTHYLDVSATVNVYDWNTGSITPVTLTIPISMGPATTVCSGDGSSVAWSPRTVPDAANYNFQAACQTVGTTTATVYHVDSLRPTSATPYVVEGWYPTGGENGNDLLLDSMGRMKVSGYFRLTDTQNSPLNLYVVKADHDMGGNIPADDNLKNVVQTIPVVAPTSGTGWQYRVVAVDLGTSMAYKRVKLAIGRATLPGVSVGAEWTAITPQTGGSGLWRVDLSWDYGGTASLSPALPASGTAVSPFTGAYYFTTGTTVTATATSNPGNPPFTSWTVDSGTSTTNPYTLTSVSADHRLIAHFGIPLTISVNNPALGFTRPDVGTSYYTAGSIVPVYAFPTTGYRLGYWTQDGANYVGTYDVWGNLLPYNVEFGTAPITLKANFVSGSSRVLILSATSGGSISPASGTYVYGSTDSVTVKATANTGYSFRYWTLDGVQQSTTSTSLTVGMAGKDHTLKATFAYNGGGCVAQGTMVTLADATVLAIEELKVGDRVLGYDPGTDSFVVETIQHLSWTKVGALLDFNHGALRTTQTDQPIYVRTPDGVRWISDPVDIQVGWEFLNPLSKTWVKVTSIDFEEGNFKVFDFTTDGPRTYFANGLLVLDKPIPK